MLGNLYNLVVPMLNRRNILSLCLTLCATIAFAQTDSLTYYFKDNDHLVATKDSANYWRVIGSRDGDSFRFTEYEKDGTWITGIATNTIQKPVYNGMVISYYKNGRVAVKYEYENGTLLKITGYYPNGVLLHIISHTQSLPGSAVMYDADSSGRIHIINGKGSRQETDSLPLFHNAGRYTMEGPYVNGLKNGPWKGHAEKDCVFEETYANGKLVSGVTITPDGKQYSYDKMWVQPDFKQKREQLEKFIIKHLENPSDTLTLARTNRKNIALNYTINKNGEVTDIYGYNGFAKIKLNITKPCAKVKPALLRGVPADFSLKSFHVYGYKYENLPFNTDIYLNNQYHPQIK